MIITASFPGRVLQQAQTQPSTSVEAIVIVGVAALLVLAVVALAKGRFSAKGKIGNLVEGELSAEEKTRPDAPAQAISLSKTGVHFEAGAVKDSKVINADQTPGQGSATMKIGGEMSGSTAINATGPLNIGSILGGAAAGAPGGGTVSDLIKVRIADVLETRFNLPEIDKLCFDLGIDTDNIPGPSKSQKARELIDYCARRDRLPELMSKIKAERNNTGL